MNTEADVAASTHEALAASVIIPAYNAADHLPTQLAALAAQPFADAWEVVVADNGSTDRTRRIVEDLAPTFTVPLRWIDASHRRGAGSARNAGAVASRGRSLLFCDADDMVGDDWVAQGVRALQSADMVGGLTLELHEPHHVDTPPIRKTILVGRSGMESVISSNLGMRREAYFSVGGFDESLPPYGVEDIEFSLRMHRAGRTVAAAREMVVYFRRTTDQKVLARKIYRSGRAETLVWDRHPELYPQRRDGLFAATRLVRFPLDAMQQVVKDRRIDRKALGRDLLTRAGHVAAYRPGGVRPKAGAPQLLRPADDPLNHDPTIQEADA